jgi:hypothetical protein
MTSIEPAEHRRATGSAPVRAAAPDFGRLGQATAVEASRAIAQVQMAVTIAQTVPRDEDKAIAKMRRSCSRKELAERAFYSLPRGKSAVTGPTVQLARELARCWGNIDYGVAEMVRDDSHGQSEMQAFAWDMEDNARNAETFIVPHKRAGANSSKLTDVAAIAENNSSVSARRERKVIYSVLPAWFTTMAQDICRETLNTAGGKAPEERIKAAVNAFSRQGVTAEQLEKHVGKPSSEWTPDHITDLEILFQSMRRGEVRKNDVFPPAESERVSAADFTDDTKES